MFGRAKKGSRLSENSSAQTKKVRASSKMFALTKKVRASQKMFAQNKRYCFMKNARANMAEKDL
jgi:hypothetical protein